jgi:hypothetical protein
MLTLSVYDIVLMKDVKSPLSLFHLRDGSKIMMLGDVSVCLLFSLYVYAKIAQKEY